MDSVRAHTDLATEAQAESMPPTSLAEPSWCSSAAAPPQQVVSRGAESSSHAAASSSAAAVPDQVMRWRASSSSNTGVKRPISVSSHSDTEAKRFHGDRSTSDVVMLMSCSEVGQSASVGVSVDREECFFSSSTTGILHHATACVHRALMGHLHRAPRWGHDRAGRGS